MKVKTLAEVIDSLTVEGRFYEKLGEFEIGGKRVRCYACGHNCVIFENKRGICKVRFNKDGNLYVPYGYVAALNNDPIEKKPFYHVKPGTAALTFGMLGCDLHCAYCQNWITSQALRDELAGELPHVIKIDEIINTAKELGSSSIISSYNEPLITSEWAYDIFEVAIKHGFITGYVSNGNATYRVLSELKRVCILYKIDLKTFNDSNYRALGTTLKSVCDTVINAKSLNYWVEVVTLVVPGFNDTQSELKEIAKFLYSVDPLIPWHITAFYPQYRMQDRDSTSIETLLMAHKIGKDAGLKFVYTGNVPGLDSENTYCPKCNTLLIERYGYKILKNEIVNGHCKKCKNRIPGVF